MNTEVYYFTGTGNSLVIARDVAGKLNGKLMSIASMMEKESITTEADIIGIIFPVYYADFGGVPLIVKRFVERLENLGSKYIFAVCTHAGGPKRTIEHLNKLLKLQGGTLSAGFTVKMSVPYSPSLKMKRAIFRKEINSREAIAKDSDKQQELYDEWKNKLEVLTKHISDLDKGVFETTGSSVNAISLPLLSLSKFLFRLRYKKLAKVSKSKLEGKSYYSFESLVQLADKSFGVNENCNGCGICARICPVGNIKMVNNSPIWHHHCETCFACYVWCPNDAIYGEIVAYNKKYHHPNVKVSDMIINR